MTLQCLCLRNVILGGGHKVKNVPGKPFQLLLAFIFLLVHHPVPLVCPEHLTMSSVNTAAMDPTKMGVGRAIAVLTSGGDAQGKLEVEFGSSFIFCCTFADYFMATLVHPRV